jgi:hypothetical protein
MIFDLTVFSGLSHTSVIVGGWRKVLARMSTALIGHQMLRTGCEAACSRTAYEDRARLTQTWQDQMITHIGHTGLHHKKGERRVRIGTGNNE